MKNNTLITKSAVLALFVGVIWFSFASVAMANSYNTATGVMTYDTQYGYSYPPANQYGYQSQYGYSYAPSYASYNTNHQPTFWSTPLTSAMVNRLYIYGANATDPDSDPLQFTLVQAPLGMTINSDTGLIRWTPTTGQGGLTYQVTVSTNDLRGGQAFQSFSVTVGGNQNAQATTASTKNTSASSASSKSNTVKKLQISDILVTSGPRNIYNSASGVNCSAVVSWTTNLPSAGQVVYGEVAQHNVDNFNYEQAATEGSSLQTSHSVTLPSCLKDATYYFRVIAFTSSERVVSDEQTILPLQIEVAGQSSAPAGTASALETFGKFIFNPIVLLLLIAVIVFFVVKMFRGRSNGPTAGDEPTISIPQH